MKLNVATWNVNSIKVRLEHVLEWCTQNPIDILCLQETKSLDENFPESEIKAAGFEVIFCGEKQYNGVAILSRHKFEDAKYEMENDSTGQKRFLAATVKGIRVINVYVPNGESLESPKYEYKLDWLDQLEKYVKHALANYQYVVVMGDFNIAPNDIDVYDAKIWQDRILVSPPEREAFQRLLSLGMDDLFRVCNPDLQSFSWWNYRAFAYKRKHGLRIDHIVVSKELSKFCKSCFIDENPRKLERPSDHTPVGAVFTI